jgi:hypothetical protein
MLLRDFYKNTVKTNEEDGAWAGCYYGVFSKVIRDNNYKRVAEVGIGYGTHAKYILETTSVDELILVDPMKFYPNDGFANDVCSTISKYPEHFDEMYELITEYLSGESSRFVWYRQPSLSITDSQVAPASLDCVFADGDHSYLAVLSDLRFWWGKVRIGGQLLGDDIWIKDVERAVREFSAEIGVGFDLLTRDDRDYKIYRFHKQ